MKRKKVVKQRGSKTHGYGSKKKHRGAGSRGGRGMAGVTKHRKVWVMKYAPEHIGKRGFKSLGQRRVAPAKAKAINLRDVDRLARNLTKGKGSKEIDLGKLGYDKVLSAGKISKPLTIRARAFSEAAKHKIEKSGGKVIVTAEE